MHRISKEFSFSASHRLEGLPEDHPCSRLHGHNYVIELALEGDLDDIGFVHDYRALAPFKDYLDDVLDHRHLNDVLEGNPTAERMSALLCKTAVQVLALPRTVHRVHVGVSETPKTWARYSVDLARARSVEATVEIHIEDNTGAAATAAAIRADEERYRWGRQGRV